MDQTARREKGRGVVRSLHMSELEAAGRARAKALQEADAQLERIARRLPAALQAGLSLSEIGRVTGVSRPTLYELRGRHSDEPGDIRFALLQLIATRGAVPVPKLAAEFGRPQAEYNAVLDGLIESGLIDQDVDDSSDPVEVLYVLTPNGYGTLEHWEFEDLEDGAP
jgi:transcriptional regulator with XRE-family HTH domain